MQIDCIDVEIAAAVVAVEIESVVAEIVVEAVAAVEAVVQH